jgi:hypothetical protein
VALGAGTIALAGLLWDGRETMRTAPQSP